MSDTYSANLNCEVLACGAWGPGFTNWEELVSLLLSNDSRALEFQKPAPAIIPANERRRSPLLVKMAVETSWQAINASGLAAQDVVCVFGSGFGDTDITDYLCRTLTTDLKQLSPTKFHNSVHNTAAGYWTISTHCMQAANSIAAYEHTAGMMMLEAISQCIEQHQPVLITLYDTAVTEVLAPLFPCRDNLALSIVIAPKAYDGSAASLSLRTHNNTASKATINNPQLRALANSNPSAQLLGLMQVLACAQQTQPTDKLPSVQLSINAKTSVELQVERTL